ncbi:hypothetical protein E1212_09315 [Jiangella ureilytica]|uniref:Uncharacterized protein n=1 Tax=Jiangella ureilytica TaxID=2530374 RepID=A0A4R4RQS1_9ACTN|nr:hypothetical protein [Jiangella ureilytica]TDC52247.1 hypothetical protein E1212_09315 [Jiangella ureilytica]
MAQAGSPIWVPPPICMIWFPSRSIGRTSQLWFCAFQVNTYSVSRRNIVILLLLAARPGRDPSVPELAHYFG